MDVVSSCAASRVTFISVSASKRFLRVVTSSRQSTRLFSVLPSRSPTSRQQDIYTTFATTPGGFRYSQNPSALTSHQIAPHKASFHSNHIQAFCASGRLPSPKHDAVDHETAMMDKDMGQQENAPGKMQEQPKGTTSTEVHEEWKERAPYQIHTRHEHFPVRYEASCHCGKVTYQLKRDRPLDSKLCHCTTCQTQHAAPFQWAAIFHKEDINFTNGHHDLEWYDPSEKTTKHKLPCKVRCKWCHSPIMDEGRNMILLFPSLIHFKSKEDRLKFEPRCHMFYGQRVMDIPDGKPKWAGLNNDSEQILEDKPINEKEQYSQG